MKIKLTTLLNRIILLLTIFVLSALCACDNSNDAAQDTNSNAPVVNDNLDKITNSPTSTVDLFEAFGEDNSNDKPTETEATDILSDHNNITEENFEDTMNEFYISEITDDIFNRIKGKSFKDDCTLPVTDLRYLHLLYNDFDNNTCTGEMIVNKYIAEDVLNIFEELYNSGYQIERIRLVDEYDAVDESSMADNNSSAFNFRFISYTTTVSKHGLGMAIDINPLYNPYVKDVDGRMNVEPANATAYVDRSADFPHKIDTNDLAYKLFTEHGFSWGGSWNSSKDYQHFEVPSDVIRQYYKDW